MCVRLCAWVWKRFLAGRGAGAFCCGRVICWACRHAAALRRLAQACSLCPERRFCCLSGLLPMQCASALALPSTRRCVAGRTQGAAEGGDADVGAAPAHGGSPGQGAWRGLIRPVLRPHRQRHHAVVRLTCRGFCGGGGGSFLKHHSSLAVPCIMHLRGFLRLPPPAPCSHL